MERPPEEPINKDSHPEELMEMLKRQAGQEETYTPETTAANYDPANSSQGGEQHYLRGEQGYVAANENQGRSESYTYKSDQDFIEQRKTPEAQLTADTLAENQRANAPTIGRAKEKHFTDAIAPDNEPRAAVGPEGTGHDEI